jgi:RNA polymerase sigma factor (TIGR02999 family)
MTEDEEIYSELRKVAAIHLSRSAPQASMEPTQLVHEVWLRLSSSRNWKSRTHFLALASRTMRSVLIDSIRARMAQKRSGQWQRLDWDTGMDGRIPGIALPLDQMLELDRALDLLAEEDPRKAQVVEMRFFAGMEFEEIAEELGVSCITVKRDWQFSRAWLYGRLTDARPPATGPDE